MRSGRTVAIVLAQLLRLSGRAIWGIGPENGHMHKRPVVTCSQRGRTSIHPSTGEGRSPNRW